MKGKHIKSEKMDAKFFIGLILMIMGAWVLVQILHSFVFQTYEVPTGSMETTICEGDMVFAEKITYKTSSPQPGDIVTFYDPYGTKTLIKRVIATEGQVIDIKDGVLYIDGVAQVEPYVTGVTEPLSYSIIEYPYTVPSGRIWVMGDNRENSSDSRYFGSISVNGVLEKAAFIYWPLNRIGSL